MVAKYALTVVDYSSVEEAVAVIFGDSLEDDRDGLVRHPFFGYLPDGYGSLDPEAGDVIEKCFVCEKPRANHDNAEGWDKLEAQEAKLIGAYQPLENMTRRQSSHN